MESHAHDGSIVLGFRRWPGSSAPGSLRKVMRRLWYRNHALAQQPAVYTKDGIWPVLLHATGGTKSQSTDAAKPFSFGLHSFPLSLPW